MLVVPLTTVMVEDSEATELVFSGEDSLVALEGTGTACVWVTAWLVVKTEVWVSVTGQMVVETAMTTVVTISLWLSVLAGQSVTVAAHEVMVWMEVE